MQSPFRVFINVSVEKFYSHGDYLLASHCCGLIGRTETIWDVLNPKWVRAFSFSPDTPLSAKFMVSVFDRDSKTQKLSEQDLIGSAEVSLQQVLDAGTTGVLLPLANKKIKDAGNVMIVGECYDEKDESHELFLGTCKFKNTSLFGKVLSKP